MCKSEFFHQSCFYRAIVSGTSSWSFLSQGDLLDFSCDKDDLCDNTSAIHVLKPHTCAEIKHVIHMANANDELKLLSSLNTLGYIEFEVFCNLNYLENRLVQYANFAMVF